LIAACGYFLVWAACGALVYPPTMLWSFSRYAGCCASYMIAITAAITIERLASR